MQYFHWNFYIFKCCWLNRNKFLTWTQNFYLWSFLHTSFFLFLLLLKNYTFWVQITEYFYIYFFCSKLFLSTFNYVYYFILMMYYFLTMYSNMSVWCVGLLFHVSFTYLLSITLKCMCLILSLRCDNFLLITYLKSSLWFV